MPPYGEPPVVTGQGSTVRLEVDRMTYLNCDYNPRTETLSMPPLPAGKYQLELVGRAYQSPGNDLLAEAITFDVGPASTVDTITVPVNDNVALAILGGLVMSLGWVRSGRRA